MRTTAGSSSGRGRRSSACTRPTGAAEHHEISLVCDDIELTIAELTAKGAAFAGGIENRGFGRTIALEIPGAGQMLLYQPRHPTAFDL